MKQILAHLIKGQPATPEQVAEVMDLFMSGAIDPHAAAAFLTLQMRNGIDGPQLRAALDVMMRYALRFSLSDAQAVDTCGTGGDGGASFNVSTTAAFAVAAAGVTVAKHGNRAVSSTCGSADLLESLGVRLDLDAEQTRACIEELGLGFMFAPNYHGALRHAGPVRKSLGVRTMFNMLGPLANPAGVRCQLIGVFDEALTEVFGEALAAMGRTAYVVYGEDGADEISICTRTKVTEVRDGAFHTYIFDPRRHGFDLAEDAQIPGGDLDANRAVLEQVLRDRLPGAARDLVVLNAGFAIHASGRCDSLDGAFQDAREAIDSGRAWGKLEDLVAWTQRNTSRS